MNPQISIIVPFYNVEEYFDVFLQSLLPINENYEVILVNDGSPDKSRNIAEKYSEKYSNVKLVDKENGGLSSARNFGFNLAKGEYVIFFDSDDYIENNEVITEMLNKALESKADIVVAPYYEFYKLNEKKYRHDKVNFNGELLTFKDRTDIFFKNQVSFAVWNKMYKTYFLKSNDLNFKDGIWFEDLEFVFRAFCEAKKVCKVEDVLLGYRQREGSIMKTISPKIIDKISVLEELREYLSENYITNSEVFEKFKILYLRMFFSVVYSIVKSDSDKETKQELIEQSFSFNYIQTILKENLMFKSMLSLKEKAFYMILKYKILHRKNILKIDSITKFMK